MFSIESICDPVLSAHANYLELEGVYDIAHRDIGGLKALTDYGTVRIGYGRGLGFSTYISRKANNHDIIFTQHPESAMSMMAKCSIHGDASCRNVYSLHGFLAREEGVPAVKQLRNVWIDDARRVSQADLDKLYELFSKTPIFRFILVN